MRQVNTIKARLYSSDNELLVQDMSLTLLQFKASNLPVELTSSSNVVGEKGNVLTISIQPESEMSAVGFVILHIPEYYPDAGLDMMIDASDPDPCSSQQATIVSCKFSTRLSQLEIYYRFKDNAPSTSLTEFKVGQFNNPIETSKGGFFLETLDKEEYLVAETDELFLSGINKSALFKSWDFNYVDTAASGQYAIH